MPEGVSVHELCQRIEGAIRNTFSEEVWVHGAISGISRSANGHVYFDLVNADSNGGAPDATLPVALFVKSKHRVNAILKRTNAIRMTDGVEVQIRGEVTYYARQSRVQLIMTLIDPAYTLGQLENAKAQLLATLKAEGLLVANKRHRLPVLPLRVALITSTGSAAEADFLDELANSGFQFDVELFDTRVQGDEAVGGLQSALLDAGQARSSDFDVVVVIRGGGARTDLVAFDHSDVARAIAASELPVLVGVGHEIDQSVADEVAHSTVKTPTAAARLLIDTVTHFERRVSVCADRIAHRANDHLRQADLVLGSYRARVGRSATDAVTRSAGLVERTAERLATASDRAVERSDMTLERADLRIRVLDPTLALARGWSITRIAATTAQDQQESGAPPVGGEVVQTFSDLEEGTVLLTTLLGGTVASTVTALTPHPTTDVPSATHDD